MGTGLAVWRGGTTGGVYLFRAAVAAVVGLLDVVATVKYIAWFAIGALAGFVAAFWWVWHESHA